MTEPEDTKPAGAPDRTPADPPAAGPSARPGAAGAGLGRPGGAPAPSPAASPAANGKSGAGATDDEDDDYDEAAYEQTVRWIGIVTTLGVGLVAVVVAQVVSTIVEGLSVRSKLQEPRGIPTDFLHRIGFPFGNLGPPTMLFLIAALALLVLPLLFGQDASPFQDRLTGVALMTIIVLVAVISVGSVLAVRYSLHEYTASGQNPPPFARIGFATFLLGTLGAGAIAIFGAIAAIRTRRKRTPATTS